jgi:uncharacterized protein YhfF
MLGDIRMEHINFWNQFLESQNLPKDTPYFEIFHFHFEEKWANELLRLVLIGQKKATASSYYAFDKQGLSLPKVGDYSIVTDFANHPKCVIQTKNIRMILFKDMTYDICKLEGEDDSLESWREGHIRFFSHEAITLGYVFSEDMPVVFEEFEVVYQKD